MSQLSLFAPSEQQIIPMVCTCAEDESGLPCDPCITRYRTMTQSEKLEEREKRIEEYEKKRTEKEVI